ncbi:MAG: energy-coupling factor transporter transmembrane protein EcfT [Neomegalonema sp.]|nr:energy-coupling factor transporter transmembrane protein EcfT [Neomegalonema sp.]
MKLDFYVDRASPVHRAPAGAKLLFLALAGGGLFLLGSWPPLLGALGAALLLAVIARLPIGALWAQLRPLLFLVALLFTAQALFGSILAATIATLRLATLLLLAIIVTLTTRPSAIVSALERALSPFERWIAVEKVSLAISLALRFIPVLARMAAETREAQWARGQDRNIFALATPMIIQTLRMADQIAEALEARGFGAAEAEERARRRRRGRS